MSKKDKIRRANNRISRMTPEEQLARAQQFYDKTWNKASRFYGAQGQPAPRVKFVDKPQSGGVASAVPGDDGIRTIEIGKGAGNKTIKPMIYRSMTKRPKRAMTRQLLHEWAHIYQKPELYFQDRDKPWHEQPVERAAIDFGDNVNVRLARKQALRKAHNDGDRKRARRLKRGLRNAPDPDTSQFGENYGKDPTTIRWPGSLPEILGSL